MSNNICPKCGWFFRADGTCACQTGESLRQVAHTESKSEPKNCGNCDLDRNKCTVHERKYGCDAWQPKAAEPQGWEYDIFLLLDKVYFHQQIEIPCDEIRDFQERTKPVFDRICAEIERVREEEKQDIIKHLSNAVRDTPATSDLTKLVSASIRLAIMCIEQNKHRSEK